ncbi:D-alanyl-D-alanine carboxypeptidase [Olivibacter sp. SDN3]|uniref:D-alanyl-D-alanine carboxypeptidase n=1 Tax=Olivibacter sp. SDN3 TaxID=2764720 RepID=UPI0016514853|nr:D-alanyl-D-alanine carboxypeptidase [Olivibacter sp. SDN3]QNL50133.1 D-alanyl-D-alanine carboxypeptidase [Olivibacter sp. SDN3]
MKKCIFYFFGILIFNPFATLAQNARQLKNLIHNSEILNDHFTGFALYDCEKEEMVYSQNADKHFTPASNTKIFTLYTALNMLGDSIPSIRYTIRGDSLIFWGTGDPTLYRKDFNSDKVHYFLKNAPQKLYLAYDNYEGNFYGRGWPYGDYDAYYQAEISSLPVGGNLVTFSTDSQSIALNIYPRYFSRFLTCDYNFHSSSYKIKRSLTKNTFTHPDLHPEHNFEQQVPFKTTALLTKTLLEDTLKRPIQIVNISTPVNAHTIYNEESDTVYRALMLPSDNFIAEQLLLVCSSTIGDTLSATKAIEYSKEHFLKDLPHTINWADGSGLSRMNLFTPESIIALLKKVEQNVSDTARLHRIFPTGGLTGTLKNAYKTDQGEAFVWAKTGSLNAVHNQSGYLITRKGKRFIYSFMNNNFVRPTSEIREEMVRIITAIRNRY